METIEKINLEEYLSKKETVIVDGNCGKPIMWGREITRFLGEDLWREMSNKYHMKYLVESNSWIAVHKTLTREDAIKEYGQITDEEYGPRGGWKSVTFGTTKFISKTMKE